ncbi:glycoside hydrolase family 2 protein [Paenibacillus hexagrammi]|uniref:Beta-glucuronidase n=1 Tax=Paenibacillus hexagrammi TaxID=2908839 RepID=A0ABY3SKN9_9BACL|nr:glycoside hydrolase family 2 TIM barrel-domain containing protein [Paenibacillus sp. YPD9-1]UJF34413.1 beta-glucuronidase [Paenibacillus sp. YPD9-1]
MIRTFDEHVLRSTQLLNKLWDFKLDPLDHGVQERWFESFPSEYDQMPVPACWNNELGKFEYEGAAWYRTYVRCENKEHLRLIFHAVLGFADVYWDGILLGRHFGGYTPFEFKLLDQNAGLHELILRTDSTLDQTTIPIDPVDWFHYGGIIRPVEVQRLEEVHIERLNMKYEMTGDHSADIQFTIKLRSFAADPVTVPVKIEVDGEAIHAEQVTLDSHAVKEIVLTQSWTDVRRWHIGKPELYTIRVTTGKDDLIDRIGFRTIETKHKQIWLNGEALYLQGVNRHEEHPEWGFAFPNKLMTKDLDIIQNLGCNTVRGSHYPQSKYWIDLLDERGIVFWSEIPIWGAHMPKEVTAQPIFIERALTMMGEMVDRDMHHPSIIFWSVHNEIDTKSQEAYDLSVQMIDLVRSKDLSRPIAYATMHPLEDICLGLFDVIGINKYCGWYEGSVDQFKPLLMKFHERCKEYGAEHTPVLMTEFGGAGIYGDEGWEPRLFSEDYQAFVLEQALLIFRDDPAISGTYVWQFADVRADLSSAKTNFRDRARSFNNKGLVNEYRKPKLAFRVVRSIYQGDTDLLGNKFKQ